MRVNSLLKRSFAGNLARFSFLSVSLYGTREREREKKNRRLPRCDFLTVSLYGTMRTINVNYLLHI